MAAFGRWTMLSTIESSQVRSLLVTELVSGRRGKRVPQKVIERSSPFSRNIVPRMCM
jgi:hypothetical protein